MGWIGWIVTYFVLGFAILGFFWWRFNIDWKTETKDTKILLLLTAPLWPAALLFFVIEIIRGN